MGADWFVCIQAVFLRGSLVSRGSVLGVGADWFVGVQAVFLLGQPGVPGVCLGRTRFGVFNKGDPGSIPGGGVNRSGSISFLAR